MQMTLCQPASALRYIGDIAAPVPRKAHDLAGFRIGWVSLSRLTRECMTDALASAHPSFDIASFETSFDCITVSNGSLDLIVYHSRGDGTIDLQELTKLRTTLPAVKLLVLSDTVVMEPDLVRSILGGGTSGFILTSSNSISMLASAIRLVCSGGTFVSREFFITERPANRLPGRTEIEGAARITQRERSVLELLRHGKPNKTIAFELGLSVCTVKIHTRNLIHKMGAANRTQAAMNAERFL